MIRHAHAKFAPLDFINQKMGGKRRKPNISFVKTSERFRPLGTAYHLLIPGKAKVTLCAEKGATIESYIYVVDNKREQSLLRKKDATGLGIVVKFHPQRAAEAVFTDKPE